LFKIKTPFNCIVFGPAQQVFRNDEDSVWKTDTAETVVQLHIFQYQC